MHYLLKYELADDYLERRHEDGDEHARLVREAHARGELILGGALMGPVDRGLHTFSALYVFRGETLEVAERFAASDSHVKRGLVARWSVRPWIIVVGDEPATASRN